jgi:hypothetical protein
MKSARLLMAGQERKAQGMMTKNSSAMATHQGFNGNEEDEWSNFLMAFPANSGDLHQVKAAQGRNLTRCNTSNGKETNRYTDTSGNSGCVRLAEAMWR